MSVHASIHPEQALNDEHHEENVSDTTDTSVSSKSLEFSDLCQILGSLGRSIRNSARRIVDPETSPFESIVWFVILLNSIAMASVDYSHVDNNYEPTEKDSWRNAIIRKAEVVFFTFFLSECIIKIIAYGIGSSDQSYFKSHWNKFDFLIVLLSILSMMPSLPNLTVLRSFRVLKPLRALVKLKGLRDIVESLFQSAQQLTNVLLLLFFLIVCFSMAGLLFWKGILHARCRLTPFPVRMPLECMSTSDPCWERFLRIVQNDPETYRCLPDANHDDTWNQATSPWYVKQPLDCIWPIDIEDERVCSFSGYGRNTCAPKYDPRRFEGRNSTIQVARRTCGSNFDWFGNPRFIDSDIPYGFPRLKSGTFIENLNWGFTNFDSFYKAAITTFQIITLEGWSDIMYQILDAWLYGPTIILFFLQIILCGYIALKLVLAVIEQSLNRIGLKDDHDRSTPQTEIIANGAVYQFFQNKYYSILMNSCIIMNSIVIGLDHYGISDLMSRLLERLNIFFSSIFFFDLLLSLAVYGIRAFWRNIYLGLDALITLSSLVEAIMSWFLFSTSISLSILRSFRLIRILRLVRTWTSLQILIDTISISVKEVFNFAILLAVLLFVYALIGMQLFSNRLRFHSSSGMAVSITNDFFHMATIPRSNFDSFGESLLTVFQIISGDNWNGILYDIWRVNPNVAILYVISLIMIGVFVVLNLFLAILLRRFETEDSRLRDEPVLILDDRKRLPKYYTFCVGASEKLGLRFRRPYHRTKIRLVCEILLAIGNAVQRACFEIAENRMFDSCITAAVIVNSLSLAVSNPLNDPESRSELAVGIIGVVTSVIFTIEMFVKMVAYGLVFTDGSYFRNVWNIFDCLIVIVSILDLVDLGPGVLLSVFRAIRVIRPLRMINRLPELRVVVNALIQSLPSAFNVAALCLLFFYIFASFGVTFLKGTFYHCEGKMFQSLPKEQRDLVINPVAWNDLSVVSESWINSTVSSCAVWESLSEIKPTSRDVCECVTPGEWIPVVPQNFDNIMNGVALLFEISTTDGWEDIMYAAIDNRGIDAQPLRNAHPFWALFFTSFLIFGAFFMLPMFVAVTLNTFNSLRQKDGFILMTDSQKIWATTQAFVMKLHPKKKAKRPQNLFLGWLYDNTMPETNPGLQKVIFVCIMANSFSSLLLSFGDSARKTYILETLNIVFSVIFSVEIGTYLLVMRDQYFTDIWNRIDLVIVMGSNLVLILNRFVWKTSQFSVLIQFFRLCRLLRLMKSMKRLRLLFSTLITVIPSVFNILLMLLLLFFIYSVVGVQCFSFIPFNDVVNDQANFRTFGNAMLLLFRFSTGENWTKFMRSIMQDNKGCEKNPMYIKTSPWCLSLSDYPLCTEINGCGAGFTALLYFYSFQLLVSFLVMNLFVGVVLHAFHQTEEVDKILTPEDLKNFINTWVLYDKNADGRIKADDIRQFLSNLDPPLGFKGLVDDEEIEHLILDSCILNVPVNSDGTVNIIQMASHLARRIAIKKQGERFKDLSESHPLQKKIQRNRGDTKITLKDFIKIPQRKIQALHVFTKMVKVTPDLVPPET